MKSFSELSYQGGNSVPTKEDKKSDDWKDKPAESVPDTKWSIEALIINEHSKRIAKRVDQTPVQNPSERRKANITFCAKSMVNLDERTNEKNDSMQLFKETFVQSHQCCHQCQIYWHEICCLIVIPFCCSIFKVVGINMTNIQMRNILPEIWYFIPLVAS